MRRGNRDSRKGEPSVPCLKYRFLLFFYTVKTVKRNSRVVLDSFVMQNSIEIYNSIKQGNNKTDGIDAAEYREALTEFCTLEKRGYCYYNYDSDGDLNYYTLNSEK